MTRHLKYGGSTAHRTLACPGWVKKSENIPKRPAGAAALEGSMHHKIQELCQEKGLQPDQLIGHVYTEGDKKVEFTKDVLGLSNIAFIMMNKLFDQYDIDEMLIEPFVQLLPGHVGGSIDVLGLSSDRKTLLITDYKFGSAKVLVENSPNLFLYAAASRADPNTKDMWVEVERVVFAIVQPRVKGVTSLWHTTPDAVDEFEKKLMVALDSNTINPGKHCKYCPAEPYCEERRSSVVAANLLGARDQEELKAGAALVTEVEDWLKSMKEEMYLQLVRGVPIPGYKIVYKRATRRWDDEKGVAAALAKTKILQKDMFETKMVTPAKLEKIIKQKKVGVDLSEFIITESSGTTLAPEDDSREAVIASDIQGHLKTMMN